MKLFFLLGNQLFSERYLEKFRKDHTFFMAEDYQLCTYVKHHKQKILLFLCSITIELINFGTLQYNTFQVVIKAAFNFGLLRNHS